MILFRNGGFRNGCCGIITLSYLFQFPILKLAGEVEFDVLVVVLRHLQDVA